MINAMRQHGCSERTHQSYLAAVTALAKYYHRSPEQLPVDALQQYFNYLVQERHLSPASCSLALNGIRFLYLKVLQRPAFDIKVILPKHKQRLPELLTRHEVAQLFNVTSNLKHRTLLQICYGCGLRVGELVSLKVRDIDSERHLLRIEQGKGGKDRLIILSDGALITLRHYWQFYHPRTWLFPGKPNTVALSISSAQRVFTKAKRRAEIQKIGGIHSLRHAYATHQLQAGMRIDQLQNQLGHSDISTTMRYIHWIPGANTSDATGSDLLADLIVDTTDTDPSGGEK
jgi:site-specific recombinase XerD